MSRGTFAGPVTTHADYEAGKELEYEVKSGSVVNDSTGNEAQSIRKQYRKGWVLNE